MTTKRQQIKAVADLYGWDDVSDPNYDGKLLHLRYRPTPNAPMGGPVYVLAVGFTNATDNRIAYADRGVGSADQPLLGGLEAVKRYLRENGEKRT